MPRLGTASAMAGVLSMKAAKVRLSSTFRLSRASTAGGQLTGSLSLQVGETSFAGTRLRAVAPVRASNNRVIATPVAEMERLRLHNLSPSDGARRRGMRIGRGYAAGQV